MGLCGVTARSTVFASTIGLVFQPGPHPCNPCVLPGMYRDPPEPPLSLRRCPSAPQLGRAHPWPVGQEGILAFPPNLLPHPIGRQQVR